MRNLLITALVLLLSVAPAAAGGLPDELPPIPSEAGSEICTGQLDTCEAGLSSCQMDRDVSLSLLNECLGLPTGTSLDEAIKVSKKKKVAKKPRKKRTPRKRVKRTQTPKLAKVVSGKDGVDGKDGHSIVFSLRRLKAGRTCPAGGYLTFFGLDLNDNGVLNTEEASKPMVSCHGLRGVRGKAGADGKAGKNGKDGDDGVRPTVSTGTFANAIFAKKRPPSFALFAVASLSWPLNDTVSLALEGGVAPGIDAAMMLRAGLNWRLNGTSGLKIGGLYEVVGLTNNNYANDQYAALTVGVYKDLRLYKGDAVNLSLRGEVSGIVGVDGFINAGRKARVAVGAGGGLGLRFEF